MAVRLKPKKIYHNIAYLVIEKQYVDKIKHALKPQRAFLTDD